MTKFTSEDLQLLREAAGEALNNQPDNTEIPWDNPDTGHSGSATALTTRDMNNMTCRDLLLKNDAQSVKGTARYFLCQQVDGTWQITSEQ